MNRKQFVQDMMKNKNWQDLINLILASKTKRHTILQKLQTSKTKRHIILQNLHKIYALHHLKFLTTFGEIAAKKDILTISDNGVITKAYPEYFNKWIEQGAPGLCNSLIKKYLKNPYKEFRVKNEGNTLANLPQDFNFDSFFFPERIWKKCWDRKKEIFDFTSSSWKNLSFIDQIKYAKWYQIWYAKTYNIPIEKKNFIGEIKFCMVLIPPGKFYMGVDKECGIVSAPFYFMEHQVTQNQWYSVTKEKPHSIKIENKHPQAAVVYVNWNDVQKKFLSKLSENFDLPKEEQWEYAYRTGTLNRFYWGNNFDEIGEYAWCNKNIAEKENYISPVGIKKGNIWGLYDMSGNVYEWCKDFYEKYAIIRGGCWYSPPQHCQADFRNYVAPSCRDYSIGFRLCSKVSGKK